MHFFFPHVWPDFEPVTRRERIPRGSKSVSSITQPAQTQIHVAQGDGMTTINFQSEHASSNSLRQSTSMCSSQNAASATSGVLQANPGAPSIMIRMRAHVSLVPPHTSHASNLGLRQAAASQAEKRHRLTRHCFLEPRRTQRTWTNPRRTRRSCLQQPCHWERLKQSSQRHRAR